MHGILKSNHQRLCDCLKELKETEHLTGHKLNALEEELCAVFLSYQKKIMELKKLISIYDETQRAIKVEMRKLKKNSLV